LDVTGPLPPWTSEEFVHIAAEQQRRENAMARTANKVLIADTNAFATGTWHERYMGHRSNDVDAVSHSDRVDLYLLTEADFPFVQDGWRDGESIRDWMHGRFIEELARVNTPVLRLRGTFDDRMREAIREVTLLLAKPFDL
jgi:nicotinamide riboside kinase